MNDYFLILEFSEDYYNVIHDKKLGTLSVSPGTWNPNFHLFTGMPTMKYREADHNLSIGYYLPPTICKNVSLERVCYNVIDDEKFTTVKFTFKDKECMEEVVRTANKCEFKIKQLEV
ncbi:hypothetical protein [Wolbachia endosymbiont of Ctenocephalides felis wCfeT]|uniref:hypothetical protein n=1 Tax=Wolbachia endosymbiont of Ctenocephalides felis wCfeT TaxID=2732593 RepID=UPI0014453157|nr:hypothetical protein [Wolbachia endosymbiont of Ctenocephalides felis wCfeT]